MTSLAHVNIRASRLEQSVAFYRDVIGLTPGPAATRPGSPDHVWMSDDQSNPCIHLQTTDSSGAHAHEGGGVHHIALACSSPEGWRKKLADMGIDFDESHFPSAGLIQLNLCDPDGVRLELLFKIAQ